MLAIFRSAYVKLTAFYVVILLVLSGFFSFWIYKEATRELSMGLKAPFAVMQYGDTVYKVSNFNQQEFINNRIHEGRQRIISNLVLLNVVILAVGGYASYWLARRTMDPIEQAMKAQHRFTADASHELRTPLAAMRLNNEMFLREQKKPSKEQKELIEENLEEIDRLTRLSENLLYLARGGGASNRITADLAELVSTVITRLTPLADQKKISITPALEVTHAQVDVDSIDRAVTIVLENAIKYSPEKSTITIAVGTRDDVPVISVQDTGPGIPKEDSVRIFERFYRADSARTQSGINGHGLGLPIARKIMYEHNGSIELDQSITSGSRFVLTLPKHTK